MARKRLLEQIRTDSSFCYRCSTRRKRCCDGGNASVEVAMDGSLEACTSQRATYTALVVQDMFIAIRYLESPQGYTLWKITAFTVWLLYIGL